MLLHYLIVVKRFRKLCNVMLKLPANVVWGSLLPQKEDRFNLQPANKQKQMLCHKFMLLFHNQTTFKLLWFMENKRLAEQLPGLLAFYDPEFKKKKHLYKMTISNQTLNFLNNMIKMIQLFSINHLKTASGWTEVEWNHTEQKNISMKRSGMYRKTNILSSKNPQMLERSRRGDDVGEVKQKGRRRVSSTTAVHTFTPYCQTTHTLTHTRNDNSRTRAASDYYLERCFYSLTTASLWKMLPPVGIAAVIFTQFT